MIDYFQIFISTANERIFSIDVSNFDVDCKKTIIHQIYNNEFGIDDYKVAYNHLEDYGFDIISKFEKGLSKSRNVALENASAKYVYLTDDDVELDAKQLSKALSFADGHSLDFMTAEVLTLDDGFPLKNYYKRRHVKEYNVFNSGSVSSIEIILSLDFLKGNGLKYDEDFGLGSKFTSCEEYIFITDMLKAGATGRHLDLFICSHPSVTSGMNIDCKSYYVSRGAMLRRVFGVFGILLMPKFLVGSFNLNKFFNNWFLLFKGYFAR